MERFWTGGSSGFRWPATAGRPTPTTAGVAAGEPLEDTADMAAAAGVRGVGDAAVPEAGAALVPAAVPVTADLGPAPILAPALAPSHTLPARGSPSLLPGLGHVLDPNPGPIPEAAHLRRTEGLSPGQGPKASRSLLGRKGLHHPKTLQWSVSSRGDSKCVTSVGA